MELTLVVEQETDGRWLAEVPELPGILAYGATSHDAAVQAQILALRIIADRLEHCESKAESIHFIVGE